jgi:hypothetical protein
MVCYEITLSGVDEQSVLLCIVANLNLKLYWFFWLDQVSC